VSYTYATFSTALAKALAVDETDANFAALLPTIIDDAEQILYRELDLVTASVAVNGTMVANDRYFTLPSSGGHIIVLDAINVFDADSIRHPLKAVTRDVVDFLWPSDTATSAATMPTLFARVDEDRVLIGEAPGTAWTAECIGTIRPSPLSSGNTITFLTTYLSDLFFAATMVSASGTLLKNYGAQSDDPKSSINWSSEYQKRLTSAKSEEYRKKYISAMSSPPVSSKD
jgi:hypothetical protein